MESYLTNFEQSGRDVTKNVLKAVLVFIFGFLLFLWVLDARAQDYYMVGEGDVLNISVYDNPDLATTARVSTSGNIAMPLIGEVLVSGLKVAEVAAKIKDLYADGYLVDPQVAVFIDEFRSKKATILGEVKKPGLHELQGSVTFLEVISRAGGFTERAGNVAVVKRKSEVAEGKPTAISIDLQKLVEQGDLAQDIAIHHGDRIYVKKAPVFYVSGEVKKPDAYKFEDGTTIIKAITRAGGFNERAAPGGVKIVRKVNGIEIVQEQVKMDTVVLAEDVIVVPESFF